MIAKPDNTLPSIYLYNYNGQPSKVIETMQPNHIPHTFIYTYNYTYT